MIINEKYYPIIESVIKLIDDEYKRLYWNANQEEAEGFTVNSGERIENDVFSGRAYYWGDDEDEIKKPNFEYNGLKVEWYKALGRDTYIEADSEIDMDFLSKMQIECFNALKKQFHECDVLDDDYSYDDLWNLDISIATYLKDHLQAFIDACGSIVDLNAEEFVYNDKKYTLETAILFIISSCDKYMHHFECNSLKEEQVIYDQMQEALGVFRLIYSQLWY